MVRFLRIAISVLILNFLSNRIAYGQATLGASPYVQNFNSIGGGLPVGWSVRTGSSASALGTSGTYASAVTTWASTTGNFRNVAAAAGLVFNSTSTDQNNSTNRALALRQTGSFGDPGGAFVFQISNTTGLSNFSLSFKLQSLDGSAAGRTAGWKVDYGFGTAPTSFSAVTTNPAAPTTTLAASGASWGSTDVTVAFGSALDDKADNVWIRIVTLATTTGSGSRPTTGIDDFQLSYAVGDVLPPVFASTYPKISSYATDGFSVKSKLSEPGKSYFVILPDAAPAPSTAQVKAGQDATGTPLAGNLFGFVSNTSPSSEASTSITGLSAATDYDVYVVAEDNFSNIQASPVKIDARTNTIGDISSPGYTSSYPIVSAVSAKTFTLKTNLDEIGRTYFVILPLNATAPTSAQVAAGKDGSNTSLAANFFGTIDVAVSNTEYNAAISGLTPNTVYDVYFASEDNVPNLQTVLTKLTATTVKLFEENFNDCNGTPSFSSFSVTGDQVWACADFGYNATKGLRMNGFAGSAVANEDWLISPQLDLTTDAGLSFYSQFSFAGNGLQLKISSDYSGVGNPSSATWTDLNGNFPTVAVGSTSTLLSDWTFSNVDLSAYASQKVYLAFVYTSTGSAAARWTLDEVNVTNAAPSYMSVVPAGLIFSSVGEVKSYALKGINLINDVTITAPTSFGISKDNVTFNNSLSFTAAEANANPTVYVKFNLTGSGTSTYTGVITHTSSGVSPRNVAVTGADKSKTFDITTYNLEFFGADVVGTGGEFGPVDDPLQIANVTTVLQTIGADVYGVEEVANDAAFNTLVSNLSGYDKILSDRWSYSFNGTDPNFPPQKVGFIYKTSTVQVVSSRVMFAKLYDDVRAAEAVSLSSALALLPGYPSSGGNTPSNFWSSGRLPFMATVDVTINGIKKRIRIIDIHAKSGSAPADYDRRKYDVKVLRDSLVANYANDNIILVGDYNDDVDTSINTGAPTSYDSFVSDVNNFTTLTLSLSQGGAFSFPSSSSFLDHIIISNELTPNYVSNSVLIEDPRTYIASYTTTTSDHLPVSARFEITKSPQTITFGALTAKTFGDATFDLTGTSSSGLAVSYVSSDPTIASVSGKTVTIHKVGSVSITASQAGDDAYLAASDVVQSLVINKASQTITFGALAAKTFGDATFDLTATNTSNLVVSFTSSDPSVASITGKTVTINKAGTVSIIASQAGDDNYSAATAVEQSLVINKAAQTITFSALPAKTFGDATFDLSSTSTSGLPVGFTSSDPTIASISEKTVTIKKGGTVTITASQAGDANYLAATDVTQSLAINKAGQTITFTTIPTKTVGDAAFSMSATSTSSLTVSFSTTSDNVTLSGSQVTIVKAGSVTITAAQAGNDNYSSATSVNQTFCINPAKPTITLSNVNTESPTLTSSAPTGNQWYLNGAIITGATNATYSVTAAGIYKVQVKADNCLSAFSSDTPLIVTGDIEQIDQPKVAVYPNPVEDYLMISGLNEETTECFITDMTGRTATLKLEKQNGSHRADVRNYGAGLYLARIQSSNSVQQIKFIKK